MTAVGPAHALLAGSAGSLGAAKMAPVPRGGWSDIDLELLVADRVLGAKLPTLDADAPLLLEAFRAKRVRLAALQGAPPGAITVGRALGLPLRYLPPMSPRPIIAQAA